MLAAVVVEIVRIRMGILVMILMKVLIVTGHTMDSGSVVRCVMGLMVHLRRAATQQAAGTRTSKRNRRRGMRNRRKGDDRGSM